MAFTEGKHGTSCCGGHTALGITPAADNKTPATSNANTRIGNLTTRTTGMGRDKRK